jgi:hypothetical protein
VPTLRDLRSGCPLLDMLQSYNLRSSSVDSMVNDSYRCADMIEVLENGMGEVRPSGSQFRIRTFRRSSSLLISSSSSSFLLFSSSHLFS